MISSGVSLLKQSGEKQVSYGFLIYHFETNRYLNVETNIPRKIVCAFLVTLFGGDPFLKPCQLEIVNKTFQNRKPPAEENGHEKWLKTACTIVEAKP